jgi:8-oxo-dGTP diphosphatase
MEHPPIHPKLSEMGPETPIGKGAYWNWGPNYTADPIVITDEQRPRVLLIKRSDTGDYALPGGFVDDTELHDPILAAYRELKEETGLTIEVEGELIYQGVVDDPRATANAWPETSAYVFTISEPIPVKAGDDAREANWYFIDDLPSKLYGSHAALIEKALEKRTPQRTIEEVLAIPSNERDIVVVDAGHMAYDHYFTRHHEDHLFVKAHDSSRFTDPFREAHSRAYLEKEYALYNHLKRHNYSAIANRVALVDDSLLAMDALHTDDGWRWRAPIQTDEFDRYVRDTLDSFKELQLLESPATPKYHQNIQDTYTTLWREGWDSIDDQSLEQIVTKVRQFSSNWSEEQQKASERLISDLPTIKLKSRHFDREQPLFMAHNDARQSNIAWHPNHGTRLVDWSWGDTGLENADATMFLIDLVKSGRDISAFEQHINNDQAYILIGFWLAHSLWETRDGSMSVREHQVASALAAYKVLNDGNSTSYGYFKGNMLN